MKPHVAIVSFCVAWTGCLMFGLAPHAVSAQTRSTASSSSETLLPSDFEDDDDETEAPEVSAPPSSLDVWTAGRPDGQIVDVAQEHVADLAIVVSIDGLRPDAIRPSHTTLRRLMRSGAVATHAQTIPQSSTLPSHASMVSGVPVAQHGLGFNGWRPERGRIQFPTMFRMARAAGLPTAMFVAKRKLEHLVEPDGGAERFVFEGARCEGISRTAAAYIRRQQRGVIFVHMSEPDAAGHRRGWMSPLYRRAVTDADRCLQHITSAIAESPGRRRAILIVTSDHGGHARSHGGGLPIDRHIPWIASGVPIARAQIHRDVTTMDTAATVLSALGLPLASGTVGSPVSEAFRRRNLVIARTARVVNPGQRASPWFASANPP